MTSIETLLSAISRAEASGNTDDEQARIDLGKEFGHKVIGLIYEYARPGRMTVLEVEKILAGVLGCTIKSCRTAGPISGTIIATEICQIILDLAMEEDH